MDAAELYLDLLKKVLLRRGFETGYRPIQAASLPHRIVARYLSARDIKLVEHDPYQRESSTEGRGLPSQAETMIGLKRLDNLQACVTEVIRDGIPGDLIETGVWRGGATIFMRAILKAYGDTERIVWAADSFQGLPAPDEAAYPADAGDPLHTIWELAVSLDQVQDNFRRYGLLDEQVRFLPGWFRDTLPTAPIEHLAVMRLDGDMYESTMIAMESLYPKLSIGGYVIVDDYSLGPCAAAINKYREQHHITDPIEEVDWTGVFWRRAS